MVIPTETERQHKGDPRFGHIWWVKYYVNGQPIRESTGTEKETEAHGGCWCGRAC